MPATHSSPRAKPSTRRELKDAEAQLAAGKAKLDEGYAAQAAGQAQLKDAEAQLAAGKAKLDAGYAELNAGGQQIDNGRAQLNSAAAQLKEGEQALDEAAAQLEEGRETLAQNREELSESMSALDAVSGDEALLAEQMDQLFAEPGLKEEISRNASPLEALDQAELFFRSRVEAAAEQEHIAGYLAILLAVAAFCALVALLLSTRWTRFPAVLAMLAMLLSAAAAILWHSRCVDLSPWMMLAAALLAVSSAINGVLLIRGEGLGA